MSALQCLPTWEWLGYLVAVIGVVGTGVGIACAYAGAKLAIKLCAKQQGCKMRIDAERAQTTQDLEAQLRALHMSHPELSKLRRATDAALRETGENPAIPEAKP